MEIRQLRHFLAVARSRSFTTAASGLHMSQPALSQSIGRLETELGCPLFLRNKQNPGHGVLLTAAGETLLGEGAAIVAAVVRAEERTRRAGASAETISIAVGFTSGTPADLIARALSAASSSDGIDVIPVELEWGREHLALLHGVADLAFLQRAPRTELPDHDVHVLGTLPRVVLVPAGHRLALAASVNLAELGGESILDPGSAQGLPGYRDFWLGEPRPRDAPRGRVVGPAVRTVEEMYSFVAAGRGLAITASTVADGATRTDVVALAVEGLGPVEIGIAALSDDRRAAVGAVFRSISRGPRS